MFVLASTERSFADCFLSAGLCTKLHHVFSDVICIYGARITSFKYIVVAMVIFRDLLKTTGIN